MRSGESIGVRVRRFVRLACAIATTAVLFAPILLGPATAWAQRALGGEPVHQCACGMAPGKCGCPECARLEHERQNAKKPLSYRAFKSSCNDDAPMTLAAALPLVTMPSVDPLPPPRAERRTPTLLEERLSPRGRDRPPTPPPRDLAA